MIINKRQLTDQLAEGGEGIIYKLNDRTLVKIYKDTVDIKTKEMKVKKLISLNLPSNIIKPIDVAVDSQNNFIGYVMPFIKDCEEIKKLSNKKFVSSNDISVKDISVIFSKVKEVVKELHKNKIYISDFNDCNILIDSSLNPYFIDTDSWTIDNYKCDVAMEAFQDPLMISNNFSQGTDEYAYSVLMFKSFTRVHPFGGILKKNDVNLLERVKNRFSIINRLNDIILPPTAEKYNFMSPELIDGFVNIFEKDQRFLLDNVLEDFKNNLDFCKAHNNYYYKKYSKCPICDSTASIITNPIKAGEVNGIPYRILFNEEDVQINIDYDNYIDIKKVFRNRRTTKNISMKFGEYYFFNPIIGEFITSDKSEIKLNLNTLKKHYNSDVKSVNDKIYYVDPSYNLNEVFFTPIGNSVKVISKVSPNTVYEVKDSNTYFICNTYSSMKIICINGYNYELNTSQKIVDYGIHYDEVSKQWLFIFENTRGKMFTYVFENNKLIYQNDSIQYSGNLSNLCFNGKTIFIPSNEKIVAFNYEKNLFKDFKIDFLNSDCKLERKGNKFIVIAEKVIYEVG